MTAMTRKPSRRAAGFSLIEAMVAAVVFMLGMTGLLGAIIQARTSTAAARRHVHAVAVATDLVAQVQLWAYDDPRLIPSGSPCADDPTDAAGLLLDAAAPGHDAYVACLHGETQLHSQPWHGLPEADFPIGSGQWDRYRRYFVVTEVDSDGRPVPAPQAHSGARKVVWVLVTWNDGRSVRRVTSQVIKFNPVSLTGLNGGR
ncbi:prepilin-type N-terminal cleavage/methylation domain-containing protein [Pyxidicoccus parkwayensis]|uniref:Prepilin-type N-terminal cleavage/methylation domain-containing protein n=1 Tax=Pyxidicoccus parkwayensis TaxID=2813578 RepID=A0ABX7NN49_9BACT|nr:prepilin-type N-terminal cleavage/methylation domain-containing protein [Pyxidicoccus parkwaysis]QSQ20088.1 prepilin-type N-terminal cleavage/methylation domain-containing protein [Pyxidicoccus parkwaysis]